MSSVRTAQENKYFKSQTSMNIISILWMIHPNPFVPLPLLSLDVLILVSRAKKKKKCPLIHDVFSFLEDYCGALTERWQE